ncbi:MAG: hypothetical protein QXY83_02675 [Thermosphaera sp.]
MIASQVDTLNYSLPGVYLNHSKIGIQSAGLRDALNTNAIETQSNGLGRRINAIVIKPGSLAPNDAVLVVGGKQPYTLGFNWGEVVLTDAAIGSGPGQKIRMGGTAGNASLIYRDAGASDQLVLQTGPGGLRVMG